ncbi:FlgD immunoglobulin-like domain containing protein [Cohnella fermenti]|uniref:FlgD/Vpr Ig-like domain-containing protein n=1 Tax=Cohnella fermenti TaxID=2565925 RepID=A0A4S4BUU7_9BACL|nr:FlgD immunoglobulin-like domain containing protein [Cohnella fermenti]THF76714.1 hypothetical protein E6C55_18255 [Cohnella fermenti]
MIRKFLFICALFGLSLLMLSTSHSYASDANLLPNAGFETDAAPADGIPDGYAKLIYSGSPTVALDTSEFYDGAKSVKITGTSATDRASISYTYNNASSLAGNSYTFSIYQKTSGVTSSNLGTTLRVNFLDENNRSVKLLLNKPGATGTTAGWEQLQTTFSVPYGTVKIVLEAGLWYASGTVWWDSPSLNQVNVLTNPGFETDAAPADGVPDNWTRINYGTTNATFDLDTATKYSGSQSARITSGAATTRSNYSQKFDVSAFQGKRFTLSAYEKTDNVVSSEYGTAIRVLFLNASNVNIGTNLYVAGNKGTTDWTSLTTGFAIPEGVVYVQVECFLWLATGTVWWDDVQLTPFTDGWLVNSSFETPSENADLPYGWLRDVSGSPTSSFDSSTRYDGDQSYKMTGTSTSDTINIYQDIWIPAGYTDNLFKLTSWYKTDSVVTSAYGAAVKLAFYDSSSSLTANEVVIPGAAGTVDWTKLENLFLVPSGTVRIRVYLFLNHASGTVWWDQPDITPYRLLNNSGFEQDQDNNGIADGWASNAINGAASAFDDGTVYEGTKSLKMTGTSKSSVGYVNQTLNLQASSAGTSAWGYKIHAVYKTDNVQSDTKGALMELSFRDSSNAILSTIQVRASKGTQDWTSIDKVASVPYGATRLIVQQYFNGSGTIWWDSVKLTPILLLDNKDFETDDNSDNVPDKWQFAATSGTPVKAMDTANYYNIGRNSHAAKSFKITNLTQTDQASLSQIVPLSSEFMEGGTMAVNYKISQVTVDSGIADAGTYGARMKLSFLDAGDAAVGNPLYAIGARGSAMWATLSKSFIPPAGAKKLKIELQLWNAAGTVWWDQADLLPGSQIAAESTKFLDLGIVVQEGRPTLSWRNSNNMAFTTIEYSQDPTFSSGSTTVSGLLTTSYTLPVNVQDGTWYARGTTTDASNITTSYGNLHQFDVQRLQAFPDTFTPNGDGANDGTTLDYILQDEAVVTLEIRDSADQVVKTIYSADAQTPGKRDIAWDGKNDSGVQVADGAYTAGLALDIGGTTYTSNKSIIVNAADTSGYRGLENDKDWSGFYEDFTEKSIKLTFDLFDPSTGRFTYDSLTNPLWPLNTSGYSFALAYLYTTPGNDYYGDSIALSRAIAAFDAVVDNEVGTTGSWARERDLDPNMDRFVLDSLAETYPMLEPYLTAVQQDKWVGFMERAAQYQIDTYQNLPDANSTFGNYPNQDQAFALALGAVGSILDSGNPNKAVFLNAAAAVVPLSLNELTANGSGGLSYFVGTNPSPWYQNLISLWGRYYELTGDSQIPSLIAELTDYYPLVMETGGVSESGSSPELKAYWQNWNTPQGADTVAYFTNDGRNKMVANTIKERLTRIYPQGMSNMQQVYFIAAGRNMTTPSVTPVKLTDQGVVKDADISGLRARWGDFSAVITAGKNQPTLVSTMINDNGNPYALANSALSQVNFESKEGNLTGERPSDYAYLFPNQDTLTGDAFVQPDLSVQQVYVNNKIGAQQVSYIPIPAYDWLVKSDTTAKWDWNVRQTWIVFNNRLIGMNSMSVKDTNTELNAGSDNFARSRLIFGPIKNAVFNTEVLTDDLYGNYNRLGFWVSKETTANWEFNTGLLDSTEPGTRSNSGGFRSTTQLAIQKKAVSGQVTWGPYSAMNADDTMSYNAVFFPLEDYSTAKEWHDSADNNITFVTPQDKVHAVIIHADDGSNEVYVVIANHSAASVSGSMSAGLTDGAYSLSQYADNTGTAASSSSITVSGGAYSLNYSLSAGGMVIYKINP